MRRDVKNFDFRARWYVRYSLPPPSPVFWPCVMLELLCWGHNDYHCALPPPSPCLVENVTPLSSRGWDMAGGGTKNCCRVIKDEVLMRKRVFKLSACVVLIPSDQPKHHGNPGRGYSPSSPVWMALNGFLSSTESHGRVPHQGRKQMSGGGEACRYCSQNSLFSRKSGNPGIKTQHPRVGKN